MDRERRILKNRLSCDILGDDLSANDNICFFARIGCGKGHVPLSQANSAKRWAY